MKGIALTTLEQKMADNTTESRLDLQVQVTTVGGLITRGIVMLDNTIDQEASLLLQLNQGDLKEDPLLGPNMLKYIRSNATKSEILSAIKIQFNRADLNFDDFKNRMTMMLNKSTNEEDITVN
ncbi:MAG: hypothetical protein P4L28_00020 [Paludibacteraceae bacterium]|nr:hypothetical protein [Paludibacteraceae bacterium]